MFIIDLTYKKSLTEVEKYLAKHIEFLESHYSRHQFVASGRKVPRTGGIILAKASSKEELEAIITEDPFYQEGIADYSITEFIASKYQSGFQEFLD